MYKITNKRETIIGDVGYLANEIGVDKMALYNARAKHRKVKGYTVRAVDKYIVYKDGKFFCTTNNRKKLASMVYNQAIIKNDCDGYVVKLRENERIPSC